MHRHVARQWLISGGKQLYQEPGLGQAVILPVIVTCTEKLLLEWPGFIFTTKDMHMDVEHHLAGLGAVI